MGCDGSRIECPRSAELEARLRPAGKNDSAPTVWVTAFVHLSTGLLWSWQLGPGTADERLHLRRLLATLSPAALIVADAAYMGYELAWAIVETEAVVPAADVVEGRSLYPGTRRPQDVERRPRLLLAGVRPEEGDSRRCRAA